jgi:TatA/E family protein of Tat protein translocase
MFGMGHWEILIIFLVILLIFGAKRIPEMAQGLGKGIREFRTAMRDVQDEIDVNAPTPSPRQTTIETAPPAQSVAQTSTPGSVPAGQGNPTPAQKPNGETQNSEQQA